MAINSVIRFLQAARNLAKQGMSKEQILDFARREFGKVSELLRKQIDDIYSRYKKPKTEKKGEVVPIKTEEGIVRRPEEFATRKEYERYLDETLGPSDDVFGSPMKEDLLKEWDKVNAKNVTPKKGIVATDEAAEVVKKRTDDIAQGDVEGTGVESLATNMKKLKEATEELKKTSKDFTPEAIMKEILKGQKVMAENYKTGNIRTAVRQFMQSEVKAGRLKLSERDSFRVREYSPMTEDDPIDVFRRYYGEDALEAVDEIGDVFMQGESFSHYEELLRNSIDKKFLTVKKTGAGEYDASVVAGEKVRKAMEEEAKQKKILEEFDTTDRTKNAHGGIIGNLHLNRMGFDSGGDPLTRFKDSIVQSMKPYAPGISEDRLWILVKDITLDMSAEEAQASVVENFKKGFATGGRVQAASGGIISNSHLNRTGFSSGSEFIGPTWESPKKSLDDIIGSIIGKREDRPDSGIVGLSLAGLMGRPASRRDDISSSIIQDTAANLAKTMFYGMKNYKKEDQQTLYSFLDNGIKLKIDNQATGVETGVAEKFDLNVPTRIDDNTLFSVALDTYNKLPVDLQAKIKASTNLAKDESWSALVEGNNLGITYNSDNQKIEGYYDVKLDSETLKPTIIKPKFEKDNINNETIHSMFIGHGDFPPNPENFMNPEHYQMAMQAWIADKDKEYFGIDLVSKPDSDYTGVRGTFDTKNVSGWGAVETGDNTDVAYLEATGKIPNYLLKNVEPIELSTSLYKDLETKDKEAMIRADIPISDSLTPYIQSTTGDWEDALKYGINLDKTGQLGDWDYQLTGNIDQDKDYRIGADLTTELMGGKVGAQGWYNADDTWYTGIGGKWKWGKPKKKSRTSTYGFNNPEEALKFAEKKNLFADGGLANILKIK